MRTTVDPQHPDRIPTRIAFVGDFPRDRDVEKNRPFATSAEGKLFDSLLRTANMNRFEYGVTNVFNEQPPNSDVANWCIPSGLASERGLEPLPILGSSGVLDSPYRHHLIRLAEELKAWQPTVIVPLGGIALWALTGHSGITALRGAATTAKYLVPGTKLLPTFHPQAVMFQWKLYPVVVGDLLKAEREAKRGPDIYYPKRELLLEPTMDDIRAYMPRLLNSDLLSVDIETGWGQITCIGFAPDAEHAICIPFMDKRSTNRSYWADPRSEQEAWRLVEQGLTSDVPKLGQNFAQYDAYWLLRKKRIAPRNLTHDTRLLHHAIYPELPKDLAFLGASYSTQGAWKHWGHKGDKRDDT